MRPDMGLFNDERAEEQLQSQADVYYGDLFEKVALVKVRETFWPCVFRAGMTEHNERISKLKDSEIKVIGSKSYIATSSGDFDIQGGPVQFFYDIAYRIPGDASKNIKDSVAIVKFESEPIQSHLITVKVVGDALVRVVSLEKMTNNSWEMKLPKMKFRTWECATIDEDRPLKDLEETYSGKVLLR